MPRAIGRAVYLCVQIHFLHRSISKLSSDPAGEDALMGIPGTHSPVHSFGPAAAPGPLRMTIYSLKIIAEV